MLAWGLPQPQDKGTNKTGTIGEKSVWEHEEGGLNQPYLSRLAEAGGGWQRLKTSTETSTPPQVGLTPPWWELTTPREHNPPSKNQMDSHGNSRINKMWS